MRGLEFKYNDSTLYQSVNFLIKWLQVNMSFMLIVKIQCRKDIYQLFSFLPSFQKIDNQLYGGLYPIILYPSVIPKDAKETDAHPAFHVSLIKAKDECKFLTLFFL